MKLSKYNIVHTVNGKTYLYNSLTKAAIRLNSEETAAIDFANDSIVDIQALLNHASIEQLVKNGFIVDDDFDELKAIEYIYRKNFFDSSDLTLILTPTFECNFACPYCFEAPQRGAKTSTVYFDALKRYASRYFRFYRHVELSLFGGEPLLLYKQFNDMLSFTRMLSKQHSFSYSTSITTNGSLLNRDVVHTLLSHNCKTFQITIDGGKASHDKTRSFKDKKPSFDLLMKVINEELHELYDDESAEFYLRFNLNNNTPNEIRSALIEIKEDIRQHIIVVLRAVYSTSLYSSNNSNSVDELKEYYDVASELGFRISNNRYFNRSCEACCDEKVFYVTPDLGVWKCINTMSLPHGKVGYITEDGDFKVDAKNLIKWYIAADCFADDKCRNCKMLPDCFGGCILHTAIHGTHKCTPFDMTSLSYFYN